jgi:iron complex outermembrane recepter protein
MSTIEASRTRGQICASLLALMVSGTAWGEEVAPYPETIPVAEPPAEEAPKQDADSPARLQEIVVTSTKRQKSVRQIPSSINALQGAELEKMGAREMRDFLSLVPGITLQDGSDSDLNSTRKIAIRGVGPSDGANLTTGIMLGDVSLVDPFGAYAIPDVDPFDLATVEVLKGPQGTLFGASALNGAIRYVPNRVELGRWEGKAFADWNTVSQGGHGMGFGAALNAPIGETAGLRVVGLLQRKAGIYDSRSASYTEEDNDKRRKWTGRGTLRWQPTDPFSAELMYMRQESETDGLAMANNDEGRLENEQQGPSVLKMEFDVANLELRYAFDWATLVSATSRSTRLRDTDTDASALFRGVAPQGSVFARSLARINIESYTQELRLVSPEHERFTWLAGVYYLVYTNRGHIDMYVPDESAPLLVGLPILGDLLASDRGFSLANADLAPEPLRAQERALFGEATYRIGDLELTLGGRLYRTQGETDLTLKGALVPIIFPGETTVMNHYAQMEQGFSPKIAAVYHFGRDFLLYGNVSRGFQFGGVNIYPSIDPRYTTPETYKSSKIWNYELGMRSDWFGRTLRFDLTGFLLNWTDPQILQAPPGVNLQGYIDNVGGARSKGLEATFRWLTPLRGLTLGTAASYIIAKSTQEYTGIDGQVVPAGSDMPAAPHVQTASTLAYVAHVGRWLAGASLLHTYQSKAYNNINHQHEIMGFQTFNLSIDISRPDVRFAPSLSIGLSNLTDARGLNAYTQTEPLLPTPGATPFISTNYNQPRTFSVRLSGSF